VKKKETPPREKALAAYVWFLFALVALLLTYGSVFPSLIRTLEVSNMRGQDLADLCKRFGQWFPSHWYAGLAPGLVASVLWLSPMSREAVHRILYMCSLIIGLLLVAGSVGLYLEFFG